MTAERDEHEGADSIWKQERQDLLSALKDMKEYSAALTHELRGPVGSLKGFAEILMQEYPGALDDRGRRLLERVWFNAGQLDKIIRSLEGLTRAGRASEPQVTMNPATVMAELMAEHAGEIERRGVRVVVGRDLPALDVHPTRLRQLIGNLFSNALQAIAGVPHPEIRFGCLHTRPRPTFAMEDNGPGVPAADRERVFELFCRLHSDWAGSGVGLALARRIVEFYQGRIWVEEGLSGGARFCFWLGN